MSALFSEENKINLVLIPGVQSSGAAAAAGSAAYETDTVSMAKFKHCTFIFQQGITTGSLSWKLIPMCGSAATTGTGAATPVGSYYYRTQGTVPTTPYTTDVPGTITAGTSAGVNTSSDGVGALYLIEVDAPKVHDESASNYFVKLYIQGTTAADAPRGSACVAVLSKPRYPQAVLDSVIA